MNVVRKWQQLFVLIFTWLIVTLCFYFDVTRPLEQFEFNIFSRMSAPEEIAIGALIQRVIAGEDFSGKEIIVSGVAANCKNLAKWPVSTNNVIRAV